MAAAPSVPPLSPSLPCSIRSLTVGFSPFRMVQMEFWISVLLTILGYLPGVLYAIYVICSVDPDGPHRRHDPDDYVYVA